MLSSKAARWKKAFLLLVPGGFALYVSGRQLNYVKVPESGKLIQKKAPHPFSRTRRQKSSLAAVLAGDARDALDLRRLGALVCADWFHTAGIERLVIAPVTLVLAGVHFDHLAATFEKCARLDHQ